ncbi:MAG: hypothetical protein PHX64_03790 [Candidatus Omnitrophica bacterium]|nr:hypothetical protein [Candidatus Omnitrophota bacterium]MDD5310856.1 hypothetical protein [Candidatus Omnitrophota bacterium]MDD5546352.1 hypothetical protein [Candidatus Omnitrophota bacterium]
MDFQIRNYIKIYLWAVAISLVAFFAYNIIQGVFGGEQARIKKFIMTGKSRIEKKNILGISDMVSFNYKDKYGNDRPAIVYGAKSFVSYYKDVFINIESVDIKLNAAKTEADVEVVALIIGRTGGGASETIMQGLEGEKDKFRLKLIKEEDGWKLLELEFLQPVSVMGETIGCVPAPCRDYPGDPLSS